MTSTEPSIIEPTAYLGCNTNRLSRVEILQQQQLQQFHSQICEHNCVCSHNQHPLLTHHHHSNLIIPNSGTNDSGAQPAFNHFNNPHHHHHPHNGKFI